MFNARLASWLLCIPLIMCFLIPAGADEIKDVLVLYDERALGSQYETMLAVRTALTGMNKAARFELIDLCQDASGYSQIIVLPGENEETSRGASLLLSGISADVFWVGGDIRAMIPSAQNVSGSITLTFMDMTGAPNEELLSSRTLPVLTAWDEWTGGTMSVQQTDYPLCARSGQLTYLAYCDTSLPGMQAFLSDMLAEFFWPYQEARPTYSKYLVITDVYPFIDLEKLMNTVTIMHEKSTPYTLMVMPIYSNVSYPAMRRYCEVLRYAQSLGASIVMRVPLSRVEEDATGQMAEHISMAFDGYTQYGVYPLALAAPQDYLYTENGFDLLRVSRTVLILPRETDANFETTSFGTTPPTTQHQIITASDIHGMTNAYATAQYISVNTSPDELIGILNAQKKSIIPLASMWALRHSLYIGDHGVLYSPETGLYIDGKYDDLSYTPFRYEEPQFSHGFVQHLTEQVKLSNRGLLFFATGSCVVLIVMIIMLRKQVKRRVLRNPRNQGGDAK